MGLSRNTFQQEKLSETMGTGPRGGGRWEMQVVLQAKSWDMQGVDAGPGRVGIFAPALPHPPHSWEATGSSPILTLSSSAGAQHRMRGVEARRPSHLFISCVREGAIFGLQPLCCSQDLSAGRDVRRRGTALLPVLPSHSRNVSCFLSSRPCRS